MPLTQTQASLIYHPAGHRSINGTVHPVQHGHQVVQCSTSMAVQVLFAHLHGTKGLPVGTECTEVTGRQRLPVFIEVSWDEHGVKTETLAFHHRGGDGARAPAVANVNGRAVPQCCDSLEFSSTEFLFLHRVLGLKVAEQPNHALAFNGLQGVSRVHTREAVKGLNEQTGVFHEEEIVGVGQMRARLFDFRLGHDDQIVGLWLHQLNTWNDELLDVVPVPTDVIAGFLNLPLVGGQKPNRSPHGWRGHAFAYDDDGSMSKAILLGPNHRMD
jgi:hypothetical protein